MTTTLRVVMVVAGVSAAAIAGPVVRTAAAQQQQFKYIGPKQCTNCHDHDAEKLWYEKKEIPEVHRLFPDQNNAGHINSLKQLEAKKSDEYAKAIGLADKYDGAGSCVSCHGTVWGGEANAGVSCESCHGPGSGYKDPHQQKDSYEKSVKEFGMTRLVGNFAGWTQQCTNCHVMTDEKLIAAGHPSGDDFDLSKKFVPVSLHFKKMYKGEDVAAIAKGEMQAVLRRRGRATPTATPTAAPDAAAPAAPATTAAAPTAAPTAAPAAAPTAAPATPPAGAAAPVPSAPPAASSAAPAPAPATAAPATATPAPASSAPPAPAPRPPAAASPASAWAARATSAAARSVARPAPIDPARPPAGSPTSIEPPPAVDVAPAAAPASTASPAATQPTSGDASATPAVAVKTLVPNQYLWVGVCVGVLAVVIAGIVLTRKRR